MNVMTYPDVYQPNHAITPKVLLNVAKMGKILLKTAESVSTKIRAKVLIVKKTPRVKLVSVCAMPDTTDLSLVPISSRYNFSAKIPHPLRHALHTVTTTHVVTVSTAKMVTPISLVLINVFLKVFHVSEVLVPKEFARVVTTVLMLVAYVSLRQQLLHKKLQKSS